MPNASLPRRPNAGRRPGASSSPAANEIGVFYRTESISPTAMTASIPAVRACEGIMINRGYLTRTTAPIRARVLR